MVKTDWLDFTPDEFVDRVNECPVCYMPCGFAEPHGVYNCLGVDWYMPLGICRMAAERNGGVVAPPIAWHVSEEPMFNWAIDVCGMGRHLASSFPNHLFMQNMLYCLRAFDARRFKVVFFLSGHATRVINDIKLLFEYYKLRTGSPIIAMYGLEREIVSDVKLLPVKYDYHAAATETSYLMYFKPELTRTDLFGTEATHPEIGGGSIKNGKDAYCAPKDFGIDPKYTKPSREMGEKNAIVFADGLGNLARELLKKFDTTAVRPEAPDFIKTNEIWTSFVNITSRYWRSAITLDEWINKTDKTPEFPGWDKYGF
ncbi:MAG: creatininase family protein [Dehalococcoidales bacterium]|nr:creatininase family protein [Dehalococcoidales bacterium]